MAQTQAANKQMLERACGMIVANGDSLAANMLHPENHYMAAPSRKGPSLCEIAEIFFS